MSSSLSPTVPSTPTATSFATTLLSLMSSLNGTATDYNVGSSIRTFSEATGLTIEQQGISNQALAFQALLYSAMSLFNINQTFAQSATGTVTFATSLPVSAAPNAPLAIGIPSGTLVQTAGGAQFATVAATTLASGTPSINVGILATSPGTIGNVGSGAISGQPLTPLGYPLYVTNAAPTGGGSEAGTQAQALSQFVAKSNSLGLCTPVAIANAAIGVRASGSGEFVQKAAVYEPWLAAGSGAGSGTAGFTLYIDNGTGTASNNLLTTVRTWLTGSVTTNQSGYRPAGVPWTVASVSPVYVNVGVTGVLLPGLFSTGAVVTTIQSSVVGYFNALGIAPAAAYQPQIAAQVADAGLGAYSSLTVNLAYTTASGTPVSVASGAVGNRVILSALSVSVAVGT